MATFLHSEYPHLMRTQMFINGEWVDGVKTTPVYDPSDLSVIAEVALAGDSQCEAALGTLAQPFGTAFLQPDRALAH